MQKILLIVCATGLLPIALSYGLVPEKSLKLIYGITVEDISVFHIMRAVMGLYFGQIIFWYMGAFKPELRKSAMYVVVIFMFGLVLGRVVSIIVEGLPHWLLWTYGIIEVVTGIIAILLLKNENQ